MSKIIDYLVAKERDGYTIKLDSKEDNENGLVFEIYTGSGNLEFVGLMGPKTLGEWIRINGKVA